MTVPANQRIQTKFYDLKVRRSFTPPGQPRRPLPYFKYEAKDVNQYQPYKDASTPSYRDVGINRYINNIPLQLKNQLNVTYNQALSRLDDRTSVIENLFETWYERQQAYSMLIGATRKLVKFVRNWRKPKYWKTLKDGARPRTLPEAWLAYNFGVKPLVGSVDSALHLLAKPYPPVIVRATASYIDTEFERNQWDRDTFMLTNGKCIYKLQHTIKAFNPNMMLANVMGLTTPFSTAMSVVPWGWAVDYFVNISDYMKNFEVKHPGLVISDQFTTKYVKAKFSGRWSWYNVKTGKIEIVPMLGEFMFIERFYDDHKYKLTLTFPPLGSNQASYLLSALALSMKPKK